MFYSDQKLLGYEKNFEWSKSVEHLIARFEKDQSDIILSTLIGCTWLYFIDGATYSENYEKEALDPFPYQTILQQYIQIGLQRDFSDELQFMIGFVLSLHGDVIGFPNGDQTGEKLLVQCGNTCGNEYLKAFSNFLIDKCKKRILPPQIIAGLKETVFSGELLLDHYFREVWCQSKSGK